MEVTLPLVVLGNEMHRKDFILANFTPRARLYNITYLNTRGGLKVNSYITGPFPIEGIGSYYLHDRL